MFFVFDFSFYSEEKSKLSENSVFQIKKTLLYCWEFEFGQI